MAVVPEILLRSLGDRVRARRTALGLTQEKLAERAGLHRNQIGGVEQGRTSATTVTLVRLAMALELDPGELLANLQNARR